MPLLTRQSRGRGQSTLSYWLVITLFQWLLRRPGCLGRGPSHVSENLGPVYKRRLESPGRHHLKQRIAVAMQRGNAAAVLGTMTDVDNACAHALVWCTNHHYYYIILFIYRTYRHSCPICTTLYYCSLSFVK